MEKKEKRNIEKLICEDENNTNNTSEPATVVSFDKMNYTAVHINIIQAYLEGWLIW